MLVAVVVMVVAVAVLVTTVVAVLIRMPGDVPEMTRKTAPTRACLPPNSLRRTWATTVP